MTNSPPNLFSFATSELSQDAILAYILSWADKAYAEDPKHGELHRLGDLFLRELVGTAAEAAEIIDPLKDRATLDVCVRTQHERIDVLLEIDKDLALVIEDKTGTGEHGAQMKRYVEVIKKEGLADKVQRKVLAVYVKTGNESSAKRKKSVACGVMLRGDILRILNQMPDTKNAIVEDFRRHLQAMESDSMSYKTNKVGSWKWRGIEGYYLHLDRWLGDKPHDWCYVSNPSGGFLGFWWHFSWSKSLECNIYLQMHHGTRLTVRAGGQKDGKITHEHQVAILSACREATKGMSDSLLETTKAGRFGGGESAAVATIGFGDKGKNAVYLATLASGEVDLPETESRLREAMQLVTDVVRILDES